MYFAKFHIKMCYNIYPENEDDYYFYNYYYLNTHANSSHTVFSIAVRHIDCCSELEENCFMAHAVLSRTRENQ